MGTVTVLRIATGGWMGGYDDCLGSATGGWMGGWCNARFKDCYLVKMKKNIFHNSNSRNVSSDLY